MEICDEDGNVVEDPDLDKGFLTPRQRVRADAEPVDDVEKFAYGEDDYETYCVYTPNESPEIIEREAAQHSHLLEHTDYIACKAADALLGCATIDDMLRVLASLRSEYADALELRATARGKINELKAKTIDRQ